MRNSTILYLVRHGESILNTANIVQGMSNDIDNHLTDKGRLQAELLSKELTEITFATCYCSPHVRTRETANIVIKGKCIPLVIENDLQEKRQGSMTGITKEAFFKRYEGWNDMTEDERLNLQIVPDEESQRDLWERAKRVLRHIAYKHPNTNVLVITHGGFMRSVYQHVMGISFTQMWSFHNCGHMLLSVSGDYLKVDYTSGLHLKEVREFLD